MTENAEIDRLIYINAKDDVTVKIYENANHMFYVVSVTETDDDSAIVDMFSPVGTYQSALKKAETIISE